MTRPLRRDQLVRKVIACLECGRTTVLRRRNGARCSNACRQRAYRARRKKVLYTARDVG